MSKENLETVRRSHEAWQRGGIEALVADLSPDAEWVIAEENPNARTLRGREEIVAYFSDWADTMQGLRYDVADLIDAGQTVVTLGSVRGRAGEDGPEVSVRLAFVTYFKDGLAVRTEEYLDPDKAIEAAGAPG